MEQEPELEHATTGVETAAPAAEPPAPDGASGTPEEPADGPADSASDAGPGLREEAMGVGWRALPTLGVGLSRMLAAGALGALTGLVWGFVGHSIPARFPQACGWALALCAVPLLAAVAGLLADREVRAALGLRAVRRPLAEMAVALALLVLFTAAAAVSDVTVLAAPLTLVLALGLALGFGLGGLRLRRMTGDARWLFVGLGVLALFGLVLTFVVPAALAPLVNGQQGFFGCFLFVFGLPIASLGTIAGGWQRIRVERAIFGMPPAPAEVSPLELTGDHWSWRAPGEPHPLDMPLDQREEHDMTPPMTADAVIAELAARRQALLGSIAGLSDAQLDRQGIVGDWSIKSILAHLTDQDDVLARIVPERLRTGVKPAEVTEMNADADGYNARVVAAAEALTPRAQLAKAAETRARLIELIRELGDEALARTGPWPEWQGTLGEYFIASIGDHESEHAEAIAAGAETLRAER